MVFPIQLLQAAGRQTSAHMRPLPLLRSLFLSLSLFHTHTRTHPHIYTHYNGDGDDDGDDDGDSSSGSLEGASTRKTINQLQRVFAKRAAKATRV